MGHLHIGICPLMHGNRPYTNGMSLDTPSGSSSAMGNLIRTFRTDPQVHISIYDVYLVAL
ncbi:hypothetical protein RUM43_005496 [Polyplax serrata]|uniref:Uncharacterized protein n=1 Tax=Polyplax serrata TaxID=468196 RepID=A0AAN8PBA5_POLSC